MTVFDKHSLRVFFTFARDCPPSRPDVLVVIISMLSSAPTPVTNIRFQAAVPKVRLLFSRSPDGQTAFGWSSLIPCPFFFPLCDFAILQVMKVKLQPPSTTELPAFNPILPPAAVTQILLLANPHKVRCHMTLPASSLPDDDRWFYVPEFDSNDAGWTPLYVVLILKVETTDCFCFLAKMWNCAAVSASSRRKYVCGSSWRSTWGTALTMSRVTWTSSRLPTHGGAFNSEWLSPRLPICCFPKRFLLVPHRWLKLMRRLQFQFGVFEPVETSRGNQFLPCAFLWSFSVFIWASLCPLLLFCLFLLFLLPQQSVWQTVSVLNQCSNFSGNSVAFFFFFKKKVYLFIHGSVFCPLSCELRRAYIFCLYFQLLARWVWSPTWSLCIQHPTECSEVVGSSPQLLLMMF